MNGLDQIGLGVGGLFLATMVVWRLGYTMCWATIAAAAKLFRR